MRRLPLFLATAVLLLLFVAVQTPSAALAPAVAAVCRDRCLLADAAGTVWDGSGALFWRDREGRWRVFGDMTWKWQAAELERGRLVWSLTLNGGSMSVAAMPQGLGLEAHGARLPVAALVGILPSALPQQGWVGDLAVDAEWHCGWTNQACRGHAAALWRDARMTLVIPGRLGDYRLELEGATDSGATTLNLRTTRGPLWVTGSGRTDGANASFAGEAWAEGEDKARLETFLRPLGQHDAASGRFHIRFP